MDYNKRINEEIITNYHQRIEEVEIKEIVIKNIKCTLFAKKNFQHRNAVVVAHGITHNRFGLPTLSQNLANNGYLCVSFDLPSHYENTQDLTYANMSDDFLVISEYIKTELKIGNVTFLGHSLGSVGALLAGIGFNSQIENNFILKFTKLCELINSMNLNGILELYKQNKNNLDKDNQDYLNVKYYHAMLEIDQIYTELKQIMFDNLQTLISKNVLPHSLILISMPNDTKKIVPMLRVIKNMKVSTLKKIINMTPFNEDNLYRWDSVTSDKMKVTPDGESFNLLTLRIKEPLQFVTYFLEKKEVPDYINIIKGLASIKSDDKKVSFFDYYYKKYVLGVPKFLVYGNKDQILRLFFPWNKKRHVKYYESLGNYLICSYHDFDHYVLNKEDSADLEVVSNKQVNIEIIKFLNRI